MDETRTHDGMKYIGDGTALEGVPARDLTTEEMKAFGKRMLLASGLYEERKVFVPKPSRKSALKGIQPEE